VCAVARSHTGLTAGESFGGHTGGVYSVALSCDGGVLVSGGFDGIVGVWDTSRGTGVHSLRSPRRYERMDITGLSGITAAQRTAMQALGAVDRFPNS
jgi:WD40 repeat protein